MTRTKISWLAWNKESFKKAKDEDKPILLDISAVWCHWCHVMDKTTYSDNKIVQVIEKRFVPIRVDRDRRPDIDKSYNMGGWPSTVFLTPEGEALTGGTYIPPEQMMALLEQVSRFYQKNKDDIQHKTKRLEQEIKKPPVEYKVERGDFQSVIDDLMLVIASRFDSEHGGFGDAPKFPHSEAIRFMLLQQHIQGHKASLNIVNKTLTAMGYGGIYDNEEGGFFRYSTTRDWSIPHYEKMCEDNAKLLVNYLEAYQVTGEVVFRDTAKGILSYVNTKLSNQKEGGFYGSQDADEEYYKLNLIERKNRVSPRIDKTLFVNWNAMMISAYLLASTVIEDQSYQNFALKTVNMMLEKAFSPQEGMIHYLHKEGNSISGFLTDQVHMIKCLIDSYQITADRKFLSYAETLADVMQKRMLNETGGFYDKPKETDAIGALKLRKKPFEDNSLAADSLLRLYHLTAKGVYLKTAKKILENFVSKYQRFGIMGAVYGLSLELYLHPLKVHIVGSINDTVTQKLLGESLRAYNPLKVLEALDPALDNDRLRNLGYLIGDKPTAYVCVEGTCNSIDDPKRIRELIGGKEDVKN